MTTFSFCFIARTVRYGATAARAANVIAASIQNRAATKLFVIAEQRKVSCGFCGRAANPGQRLRLGRVGVERGLGRVGRGNAAAMVGDRAAILIDHGECVGRGLMGDHGRIARIDHTARTLGVCAVTWLLSRGNRRWRRNICAPGRPNRTSRWQSVPRRLRLPPRPVFRQGPPGRRSSRPRWRRHPPR